MCSRYLQNTLYQTKDDSQLDQSHTRTTQNHNEIKWLDQVSEQTEINSEIDHHFPTGNLKLNKFTNTLF